MNVGAKIEPKGLAQLEKQLVKELPAATSKKVMRSALSFALTPLLKEIKRLLSDDPDLQESAKRRSVINRSSGFGAVAGIYFSTGGRKKKLEGWRWHFREFGTRAHKVKLSRRGGKQVLSDGSMAFGKEVHIPGVPARPVVRPAWDSTKTDLEKRFRERLAHQIDKAVKKQ